MTATLLLLLALQAGETPSHPYLDAWLARFPTRATEAGYGRYDRQLEDLGPKEREAWVAFNRETIEAARATLGAKDTPVAARLDAELILREAERTVFEYATLRRPERDPLYWTGIVGNASVFLLVRDDRPEAGRIEDVAARAMHVPRLVRQARQALGSAKSATIPREWCTLAARQARASAEFYRDGLPLLGVRHPEELQQFLNAAGEAAARALDGFAEYLDKLAGKAKGSPRLGEHYAELFRIVTGDKRSPDDVLAAAEAALTAKRTEAAHYGRTVWSRYFSEEAPQDGRVLLGKLFERLGRDRAKSDDEFLADYRSLLKQSLSFVRHNAIVTLPDPLTLRIDRSPPYFVGQSVGGVYPAGPFSPEVDTLLYLPTPPADAGRDARDAFYRDFNHHFNVMITPHEAVPGHYLQLKYAARHPHKVRAVFPDGVYVEGWGTFCERLMLDAGWGDPLARLAHYKKQLENIARTIVDISVHTKGMERDAVLRFVREEALQDEQFASNMWTRSITSAPQLTFYWLGYEQVSTLYEQARTAAEAKGGRLAVREFTDGMMELGPVPVRHYRKRIAPVE